MKARLYSSGDGRYHVVWQTHRVYRTRAAAEAAARLPGPPPPRRARRFEHDADVTKLLLQFRRAGVSYELVAMALRQIGAPSPSGKPWTASMARHAHSRALELRDAADAAARRSEHLVVEADERLG